MAVSLPRPHLPLLCLSLVLGALAGASLAGGPGRARFTEIDVQRINVVEPDGHVSMVISNEARLPAVRLGGRELPRSDRSPGLLFYNAEGDESGGLRYATRTIGGRKAAGASLMFDQYQQDRTVGIAYEEVERARTAGLYVWDRPDPSRVEGPQADGGARRVFVGKTRERAASLVLADAEGRPRLVLQVTPEGRASVDFLDEKGGLVERLAAPEPAGSAAPGPRR